MDHVSDLVGTGEGAARELRGILIRSFQDADAAPTDAVAISAFQQYENVYSDWDVLMRSVGAMSSLARHSELLVADIGGSVVGAVAYFGPGAMPRAEFFEPEWPIIRMLVVDPVARGLGIGRRLTEACVARARRDGSRLIALHTSPAMRVALAMYLRMGFVLDRTAPDRFGVPYGVYLLPMV